MPRLTSRQLVDALDGLPGWERATDETTIERAFVFEDFSAAFGFMVAVAIEAQAMNHHPCWTNQYADVEVVLTTHDAGGVTARDVDLARVIDARAKAFGAKT